MKRIILTTGDVDGIGLEVASKAISQVSIPKGMQLIVLRSQLKQGRNFDLWIKKIHHQKKSVTVSSLGEALNEDLMSFELIDVASSEEPGDWVYDSTLLCNKKVAQALVTGPLSKTGLRKAGYNFVGHTDLFKKVLKIQNLYMAFVGKHFNVVLATDHVPLSKVSKKLTKESIFEVAALASRFFNASKGKPLGVLGLNPHAGEEGILGKEELSWSDLSNKSRAGATKIHLEKFLVPDAAFLPKNWKKYSAYLALYHDQGLIPFKMIHGQDSGVHITLGLPFLRTSVDHGTAKDIFDKNAANPNSMLEALSLAIKLTRQAKDR